MSLPLITKFNLARDALHTAMQRDYDGAVGYFDRQLEDIFSEILRHNPSNTERKKELFEFLINCCCEANPQEDTARLAKERMLSLL